ncbi:uncharacterized protein LOC141649205 [Silene latifolia]|uniref:uncharacterized protein LOC141649205 n=1 Tax=Silene latifolia TaxID=37657 RepID=UPI003D77A765
MVFTKWKHILSPWDSGGFNVKDVRLWNISLLLKWVWNLSSPVTGLWAKWTGGFQQVSFLLNCWAKGLAIKPGIIYLYLRDSAPVGDWIKGLRSSGISPSHHLICSMAAQSFLATVDNIQCRGFQLANSYCLCERYEESHSHLFFSCSFSSSVLTGILNWMQIGCSGYALTQLLSIRFMLQKKDSWRKAWFCISIAVVVHQLWLERNHRIFQQKRRTSEEIIRKIKFLVAIRLFTKFDQDMILASLNS